jgi:hypothetical protein
MNIRLIAVGEAGQRVAADCMTYFRDSHLEGLIESTQVIRLTTGAYVQTFANLSAAAQAELRAPERRRALRAALAHLFFCGPPTQLRQRRADLLAHLQEPPPRNGKSPAPPKVPLAPNPHRDFVRSLTERLAATGRLDAFLTQLDRGIEAHLTEMTDGARLFGPDSLITPELPLTVSERQFRPRHAGIGSQLMARILRSSAGRDRLTAGLGLVSCPVDVVVIAFSAGDSFGCVGAELLARSIRETLQELNHNRIVAVIGVAVYEEGSDRALDGRCAGDYLRANRENNAFDGLIARGTAPNPEQGFGPLLATIAMASDPRIIQLNHPDSNQIQRDFGKSLVSAGHSQAVIPTGQPVQANVLTLYQKALANLWANHTLAQALPFQEELRRARDELRHASERWEGPGWLDDALAPPQEDRRGAVERKTARKVIAYVGHAEAMPAEQISALKEALLQDFPAARSVVYVYRLGDVQLFTQRPTVPPSGDAPAAPETAGAAGGPAPAPLQPHLALFVVDCLETRALERYADFLFRSITVRERPNGRPLDPKNGQFAMARERWLRLIARGLLSIPSVDPAWAPVFADSDKTKLRHAVADTVLGEPDRDFLARFATAVRELVDGEAVHPGTLQQEVTKVYETVNTEQFSLAQRTRQYKLTADDVADVLAGLNWLCNEALDRRRVAQPLSAMLPV